MRWTSIPAFTLLALPVFLPISQAQDKTSGAGHFEGALSDPHYLASTKTFNVKFGRRNMEATLTVSANGVSWHRIQTNFPKQFLPWSEVAAWCTGPGQNLQLAPADLVIQNGPRRTLAEFRDLQPGVSPPWSMIS